jgi:hypothetical protein
MDLDVGSLDASQLYQGAERGLEPSTTSDIRSREMMAWLQTQSMSGSRNLSSLYESRRHEETKMTKAKSSSPDTGDFPSPADITRFLIQSKRPVPRYLLPPHHEKHIPPHIVAFDLVRRHDQVTERLDEYQSHQAKTARSMRVLETIYHDSPVGKYPELDVLMQDRAEAGEASSSRARQSPGPPSFTSPTLEPLLMRSTMPELTLSNKQEEAFAEYRQNYHNFRKGHAQGSDGPVKRVLESASVETNEQQHPGSHRRDGQVEPDGGMRKRKA